MIGNVAEMGVARGQFRPRIAYPDDRTAVEKVVGKALVLHPASVDETVAIGASKPARAAELLLFFRHIVVRCLLRRICRSPWKPARPQIGCRLRQCYPILPTDRTAKQPRAGDIQVHSKPIEFRGASGLCARPFPPPRRRRPLRPIQSESGSSPPERSRGHL